jgi:hypothetical protein
LLDFAGRGYTWQVWHADPLAVRQDRGVEAWSNGVTSTGPLRLKYTLCRDDGSCAYDLAPGYSGLNDGGQDLRVPGLPDGYFDQLDACVPCALSGFDGCAGRGQSAQDDHHSLSGEEIVKTQHGRLSRSRRSSPLR